MSRTVTADVRGELARAEIATPSERLAEASALVRLAGGWEVHGGAEGGTQRVVTTTVGAVARRLHATLVVQLGVRPGLEVHRPQGLRRDASYRLSVPLGRLDGPRGAPAALRDLGLLDAAGRPVGDDDAPALPTGDLPTDRGWVRGACMAGLTLSAPQRPAHLEIGVAGPRTGSDLVTRITSLGVGGARHAGDARRDRVVMKSGEQIGALLATLGAHVTFLERDLRRLERGLRAQANRAANADRANLDRAATAAARSVADVRWALGRVDPADLPADLRTTALARLANPGASLGELGALLDPPVGRATVHRRLSRLTDIARAAGPA